MALTTLADVAAMLRWGDAEKDKHEAAIAPYIAAADELVEADAGPFALRTVTHIADGGRPVLLPYRVNEVTEVKVDGEVFAGWTIKKAAGILIGSFTPGVQNVEVTFTVGYATIPEAAKLAATMIAVDKWAIASQRAPRLDDQVDPAYLMPRIVRELLAPFKTMPGFA